MGAAMKIGAAGLQQIKFAGQGFGAGNPTALFACRAMPLFIRIKHFHPLNPFGCGVANGQHGVDSGVVSAGMGKYRQPARSAFKKSEGLVSREMSLEDILAVNGELFSLFCKIAEKDRFVLQQVPEKYFCTLKAEMGDQLKVTGYYHEDQLIAFMTHIPNGHLLEAHYIGYDPELNRELKIYQRMLYDTVRFAIDEGYTCISLGRTAMEIKSTIGAEGQQMNMYVRMTQPHVNRLARPVMRNLSMEEWIPRSPFRD